MKNKGFTLLEMLLVVASISLLAGIVILAINPVKQMGKTRDAQRSSDIKTILDATYQYSIDYNGVFPIEIPTEETEICATDDDVAKKDLNKRLLLASVNSFNNTLSVRTDCLPGEELATTGDVNPVRDELCSETETWNIMELANNKKLSGSGYGCQVENQLPNEGFGHRVCKAVMEEEEVAEEEEEVAEEEEEVAEEEEEVAEEEEEVAEEEEEVANASSENCVDLSFLTEDEVYLIALPTDPSGSETGIGYTIRRTANNRISVSAPNAEQTASLSITR